MSLEKAIRTSLKKFRDRNFSWLYISVDAHDTFINSTYDSAQPFKFVNEDAKTALQFLSDIEEVSLILWTSMYQEDIEILTNWLSIHGINFELVNSNEYEESTEYADFDKKFYTSLIFDDKAGFDPDEDWKLVIREFAPLVRRSENRWGERADYLLSLFNESSR